jgi:drug/metabolite transporter (DMT)-like permease
MNKVYHWMVGALFAFVVAAISVRELGRQFNIFEIGIIRTGGGLLLLLGLMALKPGLLDRLRHTSILSHVPRNLAHATGGLMWTLGIALLPLSTVFSLEFTAPAWGAILAFLILGERINRQNALGLVVSLIGVFIILRPSAATFDSASLLPLGAAFCFALSVVLTRRLALTDGVFPIMFWMMIIQLPIFIIGWLSGAMPSPVAAPLAASAVLPAIALAVSGTLSQYCLSRALQVGETIQVITLDFMRVPLIAVLGWALYMEPIDIWVLLGSLVIMAGIRFGLKAVRKDAVVSA